MAITIKLHGEDWRICIEGEEWKFNDRKDLEKTLSILLDLKDKKGRLIK